MNGIVRTPVRARAWNVFNNDLDSLLDDFFRPATQYAEASGGLVPAMDVSETEEKFAVAVELPGVSKDDIDITLEDGVLTINAETRREAEEKADGRVIRQERRYGKYVRSMRLGSEIDETNVLANHKDGVLTLVLPKVEKAKPRKITVDAS